MFNYLIIKEMKENVPSVVAAILDSRQVSQSDTILIPHLEAQESDVRFVDFEGERFLKFWVESVVSYVTSTCFTTNKK